MQILLPAPRPPRRGVFTPLAALILLVGLGLSASGPLSAAAPPPFPGPAGDWHGFARYELEVDGHPAVVVAPEQAADGRPWVWHGEFFGHKPAPDIALLKRGFHIAYLRVPNLLGSPTAVGHWDRLYEHLTEHYQLSSQPALVGLSRGGLYCYNWAIAHPQQVACIYGDAPVCDFKSWPGGEGAGQGSAGEWQRVLETYGFADAEAANAYRGNPVDRLAPLAKAGVPLLHVYGTADSVVPWEENTGVLADRYRALGGTIELIEKPGVEHHPHGLRDSAPIVDFIVRHTLATERSAAQTRASFRDPIDRLAADLSPSRKVIYKTVGNRELKLHVFEPDGFQRSDRRPAFVIIHGGGWTGGAAPRMYPFADHFRRRGMVGISIEYRLLNRNAGTTVFDCVEDGRSAVRFVRQYADALGIDPQQVIVSGGSAGGHVAVGTALFDAVNAETDARDVSPEPNALVLLFPVIDTSAEGYGQGKIGPRWRELSPVDQVEGDVCPTLIFHGTGDRVTPYAGAQQFTEAMRKAGNRCQLDAHDGGAHGYLMRDERRYRETLAKIEAFLTELGFPLP